MTTEHGTMKDLKFAIEWLDHHNMDAAWQALGAWQNVCEKLGLLEELAHIEQFENNTHEFLTNAKKKATIKLAQLEGQPPNESP